MSSKPRQCLTELIEEIITESDTITDSFKRIVEVIFEKHWTIRRAFQEPEEPYTATISRTLTVVVSDSFLLYTANREFEYCNYDKFERILMYFQLLENTLPHEIAALKQLLSDNNSVEINDLILAWIYFLERVLEKHKSTSYRKALVAAQDAQEYRQKLAAKRKQLLNQQKIEDQLMKNNLNADNDRKSLKR